MFSYNLKNVTLATQKQYVHEHCALLWKKPFGAQVDRVMEYRLKNELS